MWPNFPGQCWRWVNSVTSQPNQDAFSGAWRELAIWHAPSALRAPAPSHASTPLETSSHQVPPLMLRSALANRTARQPSGQDFSVGSASCMMATVPATAGAAEACPAHSLPYGGYVVEIG